MPQVILIIRKIQEAVLIETNATSHVSSFIECLQEVPFPGPASFVLRGLHCFAWLPWKTVCLQLFSKAPFRSEDSLTVKETLQQFQSVSIRVLSSQGQRILVIIFLKEIQVLPGTPLVSLEDLCITWTVPWASLTLDSLLCMGDEGIFP